MRAELAHIVKEERAVKLAPRCSFRSTALLMNFVFGLIAVFLINIFGVKLF